MNAEHMLRLFSQNVKRLRIQAGLTQELLSHRCSRFKKQIPEIEEGTAHVTLDMIVTLARALEVEPGQLLQESPAGSGSGT